MNIIETDLPGVLIVEPRVFGDARGFFLETFHKQRYEAADIPGDGLDFVQDNHSRSEKDMALPRLAVAKRGRLPS